MRVCRKYVTARAGQRRALKLLDSLLVSTCAVICSGLLLIAQGHRHPQAQELRVRPSHHWDGSRISAGHLVIKYSRINAQPPIRSVKHTTRQCWSAASIRLSVHHARVDCVDISWTHPDQHQSCVGKAPGSSRNPARVCPHRPAVSASRAVLRGRSRATIMGGPSAARSIGERRKPPRGQC